MFLYEIDEIPLAIIICHLLVKSSYLLNNTTNYMNNLVRSSVNPENWAMMGPKIAVIGVRNIA